MFNRPVYQTLIGLLTLAAFAGGVVLLVAPEGPPGVEIVPAVEEVTPLPGETELLNINSATAVELETLPGIGPVLSQRIVAFRDANGPFDRPDQLMLVDGIGPATYERLADSVTAGE